MNKELCMAYENGTYCGGVPNSELCKNCPCWKPSRVPKFKEGVFTEKGRSAITNTKSAMEQQVGGTHYKELAIQPMELTLKNMGYEAFKGACYTKINKYMIRNKDNEVEQLKKARHVLSMWIEEAEKRNG